ncbi:MAG: CIA30 family protein [Deltaproteobacteria bacterium]|nr:CIA30 family protein [Deltaproteobacteria bacterium]
MDSLRAASLAEHRFEVIPADTLFFPFFVGPSLHVDVSGLCAQLRRMVVFRASVFIRGDALSQLIRSIFEFETPSDASRFTPIDDRIMGGLSSSRVVAETSSVARFVGAVSFENNGGFASVRAALEECNFAEDEGICLRIKGDGKRYKVRLLNDSSSNAVAYESSFLACAEWREFPVPFSSLVPTWRGQVVPDAPPFNRAAVVALGFMISERQEGDFELSIDWIRAYRSA